MLGHQELSVIKLAKIVVYEGICCVQTINSCNENHSTFNPLRYLQGSVEFCTTTAIAIEVVGAFRMFGQLLAISKNLTRH